METRFSEITDGTSNTLLMSEVIIIAAEKEAFATVFASEDAREGIGAFIEKRAPELRAVSGVERLAELIRSAGRWSP